jgi:hypothetical protein
MNASSLLSITLHIPDDLAVAYCLRALAFFSEEKGMQKKVAVSGTSDKYWRENGNKMVFHFTTAERQQKFLTEAQRLLPGRWTIA